MPDKDRRSRERPFLPPHCPCFAPEPLERFGRFVFPPAQRQAAGRLGHVESGDEQSKWSCSDDHGQPQPSPVEIGTLAETDDEQSVVTAHRR